MPALIAARIGVGEFLRDFALQAVGQNAAMLVDIAPDPAVVARSAQGLQPNRPRSTSEARRSMFGAAPNISDAEKARCMAMLASCRYREHLVCSGCFCTQKFALPAPANNPQWNAAPMRWVHSRLGLGVVRPGGKQRTGKRCRAAQGSARAHLAQLLHDAMGFPELALKWLPCPHRQRRRPVGSSVSRLAAR